MENGSNNSLSLRSSQFVDLDELNNAFMPFFVFWGRGQKPAVVCHFVHRVERNASGRRGSMNPHDDVNLKRTNGDKRRKSNGIGTETQTGHARLERKREKGVGEGGKHSTRKIRLPTKHVDESPAIVPRKSSPSDHSDAEAALEDTEDSETSSLSLYCKGCNASFNSKTVLKDHIQGRRHRAMLERKKHFFCEICNETFVYKIQLKAHFYSKAHYKALKL